MPADYEGDDTEWTDTVPIPSDGEKLAERVIAPAWKRNADRTAWLKRAMPQLSHWTSSDGPGALWTYGNSAGIETTVAIGGKLDITGCRVGDKIEVTATFSFQRVGNPTKPFDFWLDAIDNYGGASPGTQTHVPGSNYNADDGINAGLESVTHVVSVSGMWTVAAAGTTRLTLAFNGPTLSGGDEASIYHGFVLTAVRYGAGG